MYGVKKFHIAHQYGVSDIDIKKIDHSFITEYDFYLRSIRKCANNSAVKYIQNFGKIIRICLSSGWIVTDPFANYKRKIKIVDRVFLSQDELQRMADKELACDRLTQVRDVF
ncbi:MAG: phage integrase SAM-like domain-containing protein [Ginsengibacter sp.]